MGKPQGRLRQDLRPRKGSGTVIGGVVVGPNASDLSVHIPEDLRKVAAKINGPPQRALALETLVDKLNQLLEAA